MRTHDLETRFLQGPLNTRGLTAALHAPWRGLIPDTVGLALVSAY
ncbi:hypothetical protein [Thermomonospora umbrina]|uniref:Uncharacterized protein n=1 Tax=Thermomonospora umbrina TaxID=111806 RepID=A0A3D9ST31_9ACTN|nr:hypothetical protein [Thermomonospora umbrina]REE99102.1 hypothetical protein DFJ69_4607 [Thermomonospora umbrina]